MVAFPAPAPCRYTSDVSIVACRHSLAIDVLRNFGATVASTAPDSANAHAAACGRCGWGRVSASNVTTTSPIAALIPCCSAQIFPTQPSGNGLPTTTVAPRSRAMVAVSSVDSSSTTMTCSTPGDPRSGARHSAIRSASLRAGITTLIVGAALWPGFAPTTSSTAPRCNRRPPRAARHNRGATTASATSSTTTSAHHQACDVTLALTVVATPTARPPRVGPPVESADPRDTEHPRTAHPSAGRSWTCATAS